MAEFSYNGLHWRVRVQESSVLSVRPGDVGGVTGLDRDRLIYFDPSWRAVAERVDLASDGDYNDETADTLWGLTYIDEAIASRRAGSGGSIDKADVLYHLYDAQYSVVGRVLDDGDAMPRVVERIVYSVYGEPTAYPYSYADCADVNGNPGPDGQLTNEDDVQFSAWYSGSRSSSPNDSHRPWFRRWGGAGHSHASVGCMRSSSSRTQTFRLSIVSYW